MDLARAKRGSAIEPTLQNLIILIVVVLVIIFTLIYFVNTFGGIFKI